MPQNPTPRPDPRKIMEEALKRTEEAFRKMTWRLTPGVLPPGIVKSFEGTLKAPVPGPREAAHQPSYDGRIHNTTSGGSTDKNTGIVFAKDAFAADDVTSPGGKLEWFCTIAVWQDASHDLHADGAASDLVGGMLLHLTPELAETGVGLAEAFLKDKT